jgi:hypothetical protein
MEICKTLNMQIKLKRSGGIIGLKQEATAEADWTEKELDALLSSLKREEETNSKQKDATYYSLEVNGISIPIDLNKIPRAHKPFFDKLKANLKPVKF